MSGHFSNLIISTGFLEIAFVREVSKRVFLCVHVRVPAPQTIKNHSHEMNPE